MFFFAFDFDNEQIYCLLPDEFADETERTGIPTKQAPTPLCAIKTKSDKRTNVKKSLLKFVGEQNESFRTYSQEDNACDGGDKYVISEPFDLKSLEIIEDGEVQYLNPVDSFARICKVGQANNINEKL